MFFTFFLLKYFTKKYSKYNLIYFQLFVKNQEILLTRINMICSHTFCLLLYSMYTKVIFFKCAIKDAKQI